MLGQACPNATIHGFDIDLSKVEYQNSRAHFHQQDWSTFDFGKVNPEKSIAFFDCHVNHARRMNEASERGFKHVLLDDDPPLHKLYSYGAPAFPTATMLRNGIPPSLSEVSWIWHGKEMDYRIDRAEVEAATIIGQHETFPGRRRSDSIQCKSVFVFELRSVNPIGMRIWNTLLVLMLVDQRLRNQSTRTISGAAGGHPSPTNGAPAWEIFPQDAKAGEVILSKRNELGLLSNFAPTPFAFTANVTPASKVFGKR